MTLNGEVASEQSFSPGQVRKSPRRKPDASVTSGSTEGSARLYLCALCRSQVLICSACDRGQIYCTPACAMHARKERQRSARRRYQASPRGRAAHVERSRRYRARQRCVTDQGPRGGAPTPAGDTSPRHSYCCRCASPVPEFVRLDFLWKRSRSLTAGKKSAHPPVLFASFTTYSTTAKTLHDRHAEQPHRPYVARSV
jgi:hypothetical protein